MCPRRSIVVPAAASTIVVRAGWRFARDRTAAAAADRGTGTRLPASLRHATSRGERAAPATRRPHQELSAAAKATASGPRGIGPGRGRRKLRRERGRNARVGRRIRLRKIDDGSTDAAAHGADCRPHPVRRAGHRDRRPCGDARHSPSHADHLSGSVRIDEPAPNDRADDRGAAGRAGSRAISRASSRAWSRNCSTRRPRARTHASLSTPVLGWPAAADRHRTRNRRKSRASSSPTSRCPHSTCRYRRRSST